MKHALALLLLSCCALVAQDKLPSSAIQSFDPALVKNVMGGSVVEKPIAAAEAPKPAKAKPAIPPVNVRDELIELIQGLKKDAGRNVQSISFISTEIAAVTWHNYETDVKAKTEAQRLLLQALVELSKLPAESPTVFHSASVLEGLNRKTKINVQVK